jgi:dihydrofolate reductase
MATADAMLLGRVTYQVFAAFRPYQGDDQEFADYMNNIPNFVVSTTLDTVETRNRTA